jgi:hypothetical protein
MAAEAASTAIDSNALWSAPFGRVKLRAGEPANSKFISFSLGDLIIPMELVKPRMRAHGAALGNQTFRVEFGSKGLEEVFNGEEGKDPQRPVP